jgi:hypothetical protein
VNQTELFLKHARDDIDRRLIEFGYSPWQVDRFSRLSIEQKLDANRNFMDLVVI